MVDLNRLQSVSSKIDDLKKRYEKDIGVVRIFESNKKDTLEKIDTLNQEKETVGTKMTILQEACSEARNNGRDLLQEVSTNAVQMVLGENLSVAIELDTKGQSATAEVVLQAKYPNELVETDPAEEEGGGVADVVALSNFMSVRQLTGKKNVAPNFYDEPTKYVSKGHSEKTAEFIKEMVGYTRRQTFLVTHDEYLSSIGDKAYKFALDNNGTSQVEVV